MTPDNEPLESTFQSPPPVFRVIAVAVAYAVPGALLGGILACMFQGSVPILWIAAGTFAGVLGGGMIESCC